MKELRFFGLKEGASKEEINKSYKEKIKKFHPDVNKHPDALRIMQEINLAKDILDKFYDPSYRTVVFTPKPQPRSEPLKKSSSFNEQFKNFEQGFFKDFFKDEKTNFKNLQEESYKEALRRYNLNKKNGFVKVEKDIKSFSTDEMEKFKEILREIAAQKKSTQFRY